MPCLFSGFAVQALAFRVADQPADVPDSGGVVRRGGDDLGSVRGECGRTNIVPMPFEGRAVPAAIFCLAPDPGGVVERGGDDAGPVRSEGGGINIVPMPFEGHTVPGSVLCLAPDPGGV